MARPAKYSDDDLLDAAVAAVRRHGPAATIAQVSATTGAPSGSIYHRHASREHLFVALWLRSVRRFHVGLLVTRELADPREALLAQARHVVDFCRDAPDDALGMTLFRHATLVDRAPPDLAADVRAVNEPVWALGRQQVRDLYGRDDEPILRVTATGVRQCPYGLVRPYVGGPVPDWLTGAAVAAAAAILDSAPELAGPTG